MAVSTARAMICGFAMLMIRFAVGIQHVPHSQRMFARANALSSDYIGASVALTEHGYQTVVATQRPDAVEAFVLRLLDDSDMMVEEDDLHLLSSFCKTLVSSNKIKTLPDLKAALSLQQWVIKKFNAAATKVVQSVHSVAERLNKMMGRSEEDAASHGHASKPGAVATSHGSAKSKMQHPANSTTAPSVRKVAEAPKASKKSNHSSTMASSNTGTNHHAVAAKPLTEEKKSHVADMGKTSTAQGSTAGVAEKAANAPKAAAHVADQVPKTTQSEIKFSVQPSTKQKATPATGAKTLKDADAQNDALTKLNETTSAKTLATEKNSTQSQQIVVTNSTKTSVQEKLTPKLEKANQEAQAKHEIDGTTSSLERSGASAYMSWQYVALSSFVVPMLAQYMVMP